MPERLEDLFLQQKPTAERPLRGQTVLAVEDSRFASEALRLLCLRSGARVRRADSIASAKRHLSVYRPTVALVDPGLPDGSGFDLIRDLKAATPPVPVVLAISGDHGAEDCALAAGADGFLGKPVESLAAFQAAILTRMDPSERPAGPRAVSEDRITPDQIALHDDLAAIARHLESGPPPERLDYLAQFLAGLARSAGDPVLEKAARGLATSPAAATLDQVRSTLSARLSQRAVI